MSREALLTVAYFAVAYWMFRRCITDPLPLSPAYEIGRAALYLALSPVLLALILLLGILVEIGGAHDHHSENR